MKRIGLLVLGALLRGAAGGAELPEVSEEAVAELGITLGTPQMNGFVFIEGRYIPPPYTVTRKGNGIFINRIQVEQPVPWSRYTASGAEPAAEAARAKKSVDADGDFQQVGAEAKPAAEAAEPAAAAEPAKAKRVKSIDDLFDDDTPAKPAPAAPPPPAQPAAAPQAVAPAAAPEQATDDLTRQKKELVANLERLRKGYEQALIQNEFFFFGLRHGRLNGNYGTARTLMGVLPKALRYAQSPQGLMQQLNEGGVYFVDLGICTALYRNKSTFPLLEERLAKIEENEELDAMKRQSAPLR